MARQKKQTSDEALGRTHITGYGGWPPPPNVHNHLQVFADFINKHLVNGTMLDLGCGDGAISRIVATQNPKKKITGVDLEPHPHWKIKPPKNLTFNTASIYKLPYEDNSFDAVILKDVLHHLPDPEEALQKIAKLAKKQVLIIEANRYNPVSYIRMVKIAGHEHFSQRKLKKVINRPVKIHTLENHVWPDKLKLPGRLVDSTFSLPPLSKLRNYNLALFEP
ncbi:class I SAM-dependent methyltransferase [Candidatus Saccharibacteria bacterium]|nr:class I SAM-dependent methyltransferase [Candidatus Saccharibacteria bacterium]